MKDFSIFKKQIFIFSRWTRKSYAIFISLGKLIKLNRLGFDLHFKIFKVLVSSNIIMGFNYLKNIINRYLFFNVLLISDENWEDVLFVNKNCI